MEFKRLRITFGTRVFVYLRCCCCSQRQPPRNPVQCVTLHQSRTNCACVFVCTSLPAAPTASAAAVAAAEVPHSVHFVAVILDACGGLEVCSSYLLLA